MNLAARLFAYTVMAGMGVATGVVLYGLLLEPPPVEYRNLPFPVESPSVRAGEVIPLHIERCNRTDDLVLANLSRTLENMDVRDFVSLPSTIVQIPQGCTRSISMTNRVPVNTPAGRYRVVGVAQVEGMLRTHKVTYHSAPFLVTE